ncbi:MAG: hypothetical protein KC657_08225 [Myxococcales bacterium]|nr:hypothetical protein [Myxococcales bacterium]
MGTQAGKAKRIEPARRPSVARADVVDKATRARLESEIDSAVKRRPTHEAKLAGALRAVAALSPSLRTSLADVADVMVRRRSLGRELYGASVRALAEAGDRRAVSVIKGALATDDAGGTATLSAACFCKDASLTVPLAKLAASRQSHLAFGAETARVVRGESNGAHLASLAPMIKESHRIALCSELFIPLTRAKLDVVPIGPALGVLRGAERHLGRWLVLAEVAAKAGDDGARREAVDRAEGGPSSSRSAWSLVAWALADAVASEASAPAPPTTRPTVELVARLSDRPSADRDTTFLFRMARARAVSAKPMLDALAKTTPLGDEVSVRAAAYLARDHGRDDLREALYECAKAGKRDDLRGLAAACLFDAGDTVRARELCDELLVSRNVSNVAWGALVRAAASRAPSSGAVPVVTETAFRWIQWGWLD